MYLQAQLSRNLNVRSYDTGRHDSRYYSHNCKKNKHNAIKYHRRHRRGIPGRISVVMGLNRGRIRANWRDDNNNAHRDDRLGVITPPHAHRMRVFLCGWVAHDAGGSPRDGVTVLGG